MKNGLLQDFAFNPKIQSMPEVMQRRLIMIFCFKQHMIEFNTTDELCYLLRISEEELYETKALFLKKNIIDENWNFIHPVDKSVDNFSKNDSLSVLTTAVVRIYSFEPTYYKSNSNESSHADSRADFNNSLIKFIKNHCGLSAEESLSFYPFQPCGLKGHYSKDYDKYSIPSSEVHVNTPNPQNNENIFLDIINLYNSIIKDCIKVKEITSEVEAVLKESIKNYKEIDFYKRLFQRVEKSDFLSGRNKRRTYPVNLPSLLKQTNIDKILSGHFDNKKNTSYAYPKEFFVAEPRTNAQKERPQELNELIKKLGIKKE